MIAQSEARKIVSGSTSEDYEVAYWSKKWDVSREELAEAVRKAGPMSAAVAKLLGREPCKAQAENHWPCLSAAK